MSNYDQNIARVCDYINQNLDEELSLDILSAVSGFSKFHFHRIFSSYIGFSVIRYIRISRLKRASFRLIFKTDLKIIDISLEAGFESSEAFSRAFKREFGQTPSQFRQAPKWREWYIKAQTPMPMSKQDRAIDVKVINFPSTKVATLEHHGSLDLYYETSKKFMTWREESKLSPAKTSLSFGIPYADPNEVSEEDFYFDFCGTVKQDVPQNTYNIQTKTIPAGRCAVIRHTGSYENLSDSINYLYKEWLPQSNVEVECRDFPVFFQFLNFVHDVNEHELLTDIYLPIK
jgi:AraC family transcriptional regulator